VEAVRRAGATPVRLSSAQELSVALDAAAAVEPAPPGAPDVAAPPRVVGAVIDLFARGGDRSELVARVHAARLPVIAVAEHDDLPTRTRALDAGASRVFSYNKFFTDGPRLIDAWLAATEGRS
jgi:CheY-like chemotaxis protein